ncbi:hypothetical protein [Clostridium sp. BNL1100]|uniref:hypothetical protein n=1 Tax=Clostridium sp. BNL1100 TaxID=755731 RepID=UPI00024A7116|nr:hypothetical protein [Clostridium sp. BNL1100]AEY65439.1 hypothetical protein Clo1100_1188 [Clostridium sp. BNL1100]
MAFGVDDILVLVVSRLATRAISSVAKKSYDFFTGKEQKEIQKKKEEAAISFENKSKIQLIDHQFRLTEARTQFEMRMEEWKQKTFYSNCWPLREPFDMHFALTTPFEGCSIDGKEVIPCRIITSLKDKDHPIAKNINGNLSSFLITHYNSVSTHPVISDIGSWREDSPSNDASINYLFSGLQGQPVLVFTPEFVNDGQTIILKIWSWGLGEKVNLPVGVEFGRINIKPLYLNALYEESKKSMELIQELGIKSEGFYSEKLNNNIKIIKMIDKLSDQGEDKKQMIQQLYSQLSETDEIRDAVKEKISEQVSGIFSCCAGMYADAYHLVEYGTVPKLPLLVGSIPGAEMIRCSIGDFYISLLSEIEQIDNYSSVLPDIYADTANALANMGATYEEVNKYVKPLLSRGINLFTYGNCNSLTKAKIQNISSLDESLDKLLRENVSNLDRSFLDRINSVLKSIHHPAYPLQ